jgi:hypothetical protein
MSPRNVTRAMLIVALATPIASVAAQVGTTPERSPFRDVEKRQEVTLLAGPSIGGKDRAGAAPRGGLGFGARYDIRLGGSPIAFTGIIMQQTASRDVLQPGLAGASRIGRTVSQPLYFADGAISLLLTGGKSWHGLLPSISLGGGVVTSRSVADSSQFAFGSRFTLLGGLGLAYAPVRSRWTVRADLTNRFYSVPYPGTFTDSTPGVPRIVPLGTTKSWTRNSMLTIGLVRGFGRR